MLEVPGSNTNLSLRNWPQWVRHCSELVKQLELVDFCANGLVGRQQALIFLVLGFSIVASSCEAMILAFKGAEYAAN